MAKTYTIWKYVRAFKGQRLIMKNFATFDEVEKYIRANWYNMYCFSVDSYESGVLRTLMSRNWHFSVGQALQMDMDRAYKGGF
jgi:hypothetical protein